MTQLSILILHITSRYDEMKRLSSGLDPQLEKHKGSVKCFVDDRPYISKAKKRNALLQRAVNANSEYIAFIDDDDFVSDNYVELLIPGMKAGADCCSLKGIITEDGNNPLTFEHSIKYSAYKTNSLEFPVRYERMPNHLNCIKTQIAWATRFPEGKHEFGDANHGEDTFYSYSIMRNGLIKSEHYIPQVTYFYDYRSKK
jgi:hypothetical protein